MRDPLVHVLTESDMKVINPNICSPTLHTRDSWRFIPKHVSARKPAHAHAHMRYVRNETTRPWYCQHETIPR